MRLNLRQIVVLGVTVATGFAVGDSLARDGNGSSGVGSVRTPVVDDVVIPELPGKLRREKDRIIAEDGREVLRIETMDERGARDEAKAFNSATLGNVKGWEYLPDRELEKGKPNRWIVCGSSGRECARLSAGPQAGHEAAALLGSLARELKK